MHQASHNVADIFVCVSVVIVDVSVVIVDWRGMFTNWSIPGWRLHMSHHPDLASAQ